MCQKMVRASCAMKKSDYNVPHELVQTSRVKNWSVGYVSKTSPGVMCQEAVRLSNANMPVRHTLCLKMGGALHTGNVSDSNVPHELVQQSRVKHLSVSQVSKISTDVICQELVRF